MVVLINYLHVMTILPSSILVNEIYIAKRQEECVMWFKSKFDRRSRNISEKYTHPEIFEDVDAEKCLQHDACEGDEKLETLEKTSNQMNRFDRCLVETYAPFLKRRSYHLMCFSILLVRSFCCEN